jgi:hypothetical protein
LPLLITRCRDVGTQDDELDLLIVRFSIKTGLADVDLVTGIPVVVGVCFVCRFDKISRDFALKKLRFGCTGEFSATDCFVSDDARCFRLATSLKYVDFVFNVCGIAVVERFLVNLFSLFIIKGFDFDKLFDCNDVVDDLVCTKHSCEIVFSVFVELLNDSPRESPEYSVVSILLVFKSLAVLAGEARLSNEIFDSLIFFIESVRFPAGLEVRVELSLDDNRFWLGFIVSLPFVVVFLILVLFGSKYLGFIFVNLVGTLVMDLSFVNLIVSDCDRL